MLVRLSAKLERAGTYVDVPIAEPPLANGPAPLLETVAGTSAIISSDDDYFTPEEDGVPLNANQQATEPRGSDSSSGGVSLIEPFTLQENVDPADSGFIEVKRARKTRKPKSDPDPEPRKFANTAMFDSLLDLPNDMDTAGNRTPTPEPEPQYVMMPPFDSHFWEVYGNKLRVNGTVEGVCNLLGN